MRIEHVTRRWLFKLLIQLFMHARLSRLANGVVHVSTAWAYILELAQEAATPAYYDPYADERADYAADVCAELTAIQQEQDRLEAAAEMQAEADTHYAPEEALQTAAKGILATYQHEHGVRMLPLTMEILAARLVHDAYAVLYPTVQLVQAAADPDAAIQAILCTPEYGVDYKYIQLCNYMEFMM